MKKLFKIGYVAFAISLLAAACTSNKSESNTADSIDSTADVKVDSIEAQADTVDSVADVKVDSVKH